MPERFLHGILRDLTKHGILRSTRGGGGGFALSRRPGEISLLDIIHAVDGPIPSGLPDGLNFPGESAGWLQDTLEDIADDARRRLADITLTQLLSGMARAG